jgi:hypothetical protein
VRRDQRRAWAGVRGRSRRWRLALAGIPFGTALTGFVVEGLGLIRMIAAMGVIDVAVTLSMSVRPALRHMDAPAKR